MKRKIIEINESKCNGCGLCAEACHEGAIAMVGGKAKLMRDDYCDGLGDCLPVCPTGAISFVEREAAAYNEEEVKKHMEKNHTDHTEKKQQVHSCGCPGTNAHEIARESVEEGNPVQATGSELRQWPVQIKLAPVNAPYYDGANLLIAADCAAYARASFHADYMRGKITLIGCPKLDDVDYSEKLTEIIAGNDIKSVTVVRMEVPCCSGIEQAVISALKNSGKFLPWQVVTFTTTGNIKEN